MSAPKILLIILFGREVFTQLMQSTSLRLKDEPKTMPIWKYTIIVLENVWRIPRLFGPILTRSSLHYGV